MAKQVYPAPDGGWGWVIVMATCLSQLVFGMIVRSNGVFYLEFLVQFGGSATATSWVFALMMTLWSGLGPIATMLSSRYGCRTLAVCGAGLMVTGLLGVAFSPSMGLAYVTMGGITGVGMSMNTVPGIIMVGEYFEKRKGLAMAVAAVGSGLAAFAFPPLLQITFVYYGFTGTMMLVAGIASHSLISGLLFRPLKDHYGKLYLRQSVHEDIVIEAEEVDEGLETDAVGDALATPVLHRYRWPSQRPLDVSESCLDVSRIHQDCNQALKSLSCSDIPGTNIREGVQQGSQTVGRANGESHRKQGTDESLTKSSQTNEIQSQNANNEMVPSQTKDKLLAAENEDQKPNKCKCLNVCTFDWSLFKETPFVFMFILSIAVAFCFGTGVSFLPAMAVQKGVPPTEAAFLLSLFGILDTICIIPFGLVFDIPALRTKPKRRVITYLLVSSILGITCTLMPVTANYPWLVTCSLLRGIGSGLFMSQRLTIIADLMGKDRAPRALGFQFMSFAIGSILARTFGGLFKDYLDIYDPNFYMGGLSSTTIFFAFAAYVYFKMDDNSSQMSYCKGITARDAKA